MNTEEKVPLRTWYRFELRTWYRFELTHPRLGQRKWLGRNGKLVNDENDAWTFDSFPSDSIKSKIAHYVRCGWQPRRVGNQN